MEPEKLDFAHDVVYAIREICKMVFNAETDDKLKNLFGMDSTQIEEVIEKLVAQLPAMFFLELSKKSREEMRNVCAQEFIFFQVQEKLSDAAYKENLESFILVCSRDMMNRFK